MEVGNGGGNCGDFGVDVGDKRGREGFLGWCVDEAALAAWWARSQYALQYPPPKKQL